ncbi:MAG: tetratricopeptide repeat protein [Chloroflexi bacterium]|nr:tetratricopeptide repeat protein [Chloroflexota bacterium]
MPSRKKGQAAHPFGAQARPSTLDELRRHGLREFQQKRYNAAISIWEKIEPRDDRLSAALAEAHFRQAAQRTSPDDELYHLRRAADLVPGDAIYAYHLGLSLHRQGRASDALDQYKRAVTNGLVRRSAGIVIATAALELDPLADLAALPGVSDEDCQALLPIVALLRQQQPATSDVTSLRNHLSGKTTLLSPGGRGLPPHSDFALKVLDGIFLIATGRTGEARQALSAIEVKAVPRELNAVRWYYAGIAAAATGEMALAEKWWQEAHRLDQEMRWPRANLAAVYAQRAAELAGTQDAALVQTLSEGARFAADSPALCALALVEFARLGHRSTLAGEWASARDYWEQAKIALECADLKGFFGKEATARPILHNLALAYEATAQWDEAAEAWRAMLRSRPRRGSIGGFSDAHWAWVRKEVIVCYKNAGNLSKAITMTRQALKANPDDPEQQLSLIELLRANEQWQAAENEVKRLLKKNPTHIDAMKILAELCVERGAWAEAQRTLHEALQIEPTNTDLLKRMASVLMGVGDEALDFGHYKQARERYDEAATYTPDDYNIVLNLARLEFIGHHASKAKEHIERALELGKDQPDAYLQACVCWLVEQNLLEARNVMARAEASGQANASVYVAAGLEAVKQSSVVDEEEDLGMFDYMLGLQTKKPKRLTGTRNEALNQWGHELLDRAIRIGPEVAILRVISSTFLVNIQTGGIPYARRLVELTPEDPNAWNVLGSLLGIDGQVKEAKDVLNNAARLARKQGNHDLAIEAEEMRRAVSDPSFAMMLRMTISMQRMGIDLDNLGF